MSLREKAREVKEAGEANRGNFAPHGVPKRVYEWWLEESDSKRADDIKYGYRKENFCHFWRVVLFWAPARKVVYGAEKVFLNEYVGTALFSLLILLWIVAFVSAPLQMLAPLGFIGALVLQGAGAVAGVSAGLSPLQRHDFDLMTEKRFIATFFVLGFILAIPAYLLTRGARAYHDHLSDYNKQIGVGVLAVLLVGALTSVGFVGGFSGLATVVATTAALVVGFIFLRIVISNLGLYIDGKRSLAKAKRQDELAVYIAENGDAPPHVPGRVEKFFTGLGDFIVLAAQVIRTKKWKICPIVEIETE